jgi:hypothetical protein
LQSSVARIIFPTDATPFRDRTESRHAINVPTVVDESRTRHSSHAVPTDSFPVATSNTATGEQGGAAECSATSFLVSISSHRTG